MKNRLIGVVVATLASIFMLAGTARSDEINVLAVIAVKEAYLELVPQFEKSSAHKVVTTWSGTADMMKRMKAGEGGVDLLIMAAGSIEELARLGKIEPGSPVDFAKSIVGVAVRAGAPKPDISSADALKRAVLSAKSIGYSSGPSGVHVAGLFQRWGIAEQLQPKIKQPPSGGFVGDLVARGEIEIGFQQVAELVHISGIDFLGPLPPDVQLVTVLTGGVHSGAKHPGAAKAWVQFLASPAAAPIMAKNGLVPGGASTRVTLQ